ncbi:MAG: hypothetical protein WD469_10085, partial [Paenibacillaceae bacterium]
MSMNEKDVVAAKLNIDTAKMLPAFKVIDEGVRKNAESFKVLNAELAITEKNYVSMAKAMDKMALTSDERRKKILDESNALVTQRKASADLLTAKKNQLDLTNQVVDSKYQAQQAILKRRQDAIEQQEREHQKRLETLQNRATISGAQAGRATGAASDNATRERVLQEEQKIRAKLAALDEQAHQRRLRDTQTELVARERAIQREIDKQADLLQARLRMNNQEAFNFPDQSNGIVEKIKNAAIHATMFHAVYSSINMVQRAMHEGLVQIESNMAGYVQTNEHYFVKFAEGTGDMIMNTERLNAETTKFIHTTHELGSNIINVTESARLWGRMYKDVDVVQEMVSQSTKLSTVDLVELEAATKMMESTLAQYAVQVHNVNDAQVHGNRILDSWSKVAHDTMAPAKDLGAAFERTGKIAAETGVSFDFMNGLISSGVRNTALGGANLGNMWKTVLGTIRTDKAVAEIESLGVATKNLVGDTEEWRKAEDILLDLSIAVIDKNYDLTQSYADISRGVYQYAKFAASLNVGDILLGTSASINSTGATMDYLKVQMDTIQRKAAQTKASLLEIFSKAGDDGLRSTIKGSLDILDQLLIGITKIPKEVFTGTASVVGLIAVYKLVIIPLVAWKNAQMALTAAIALNTTVSTAASRQMIVLSAAASNAARMTVLATGGITLLTGAIAVYLMSLGKAEKAERELSEERDHAISKMEQEYGMMGRQADFLPKLVNAHNALQKQLDSGNLSVEKQSEVKAQLDKVSQALKQTIGEEGLAQLTAAGYTDDATTIIIDSLNKRRTALNENISANLDLQATENVNALSAAQKKLKDATDNPQKGSSFLDMLNPFGGPSKTGNMAKAEQEKILNAANKDIVDLEQKARDIEQKRIDVAATMAENVMAGVQGKITADDKAYDDRKQSFSDEMTKFSHLVAMQTEGYTTAAQQAVKLKAIKNKFKTLDATDLYGIDEDIYSAEHPDKKKGEGEGEGKKSFSIKLDDIDIQTKQAKELVESADSIISFYEAKRGALGGAVDDTSTKIGLYTNKQNQLRDSNILLNNSLTALGARQEALDLMRDSGKISLDEYNQATEQVTTRTGSLTKEISANSSAWWNQAKIIKEAKEQQLRDTFDSSSKWIAHEKATREMGAKEEYEAWLRVQARYKKGTELRKQADEQVYSAKKALISEEESLLEKALNKQKDLLDESKQDELDAIDKAKEAFVDAQDVKIRAIEDQIRAADIANSDSDYGKSLAEKHARLGLLASAVGPEGIKERKTLAKEIEKMQLDHIRELTKRDLEVQKQALEDEKSEKEKKFEQDKKDTEDHYK